jgi:hypothetical protein
VISFSIDFGYTLFGSKSLNYDLFGGKKIGNFVLLTDFGYWVKAIDL